MSRKTEKHIKKHIKKTPQTLRVMWVILCCLGATTLWACSEDDNTTPADTNTPDTNTPADTNTPDTNTPDTNTPDTNTPDVPLGPLTLSMSLDRQPTDGPDPIIVEVQVTSAGTPQTGLTVQVQAAGQTLTATEQGEGRYSVQVLPSIETGEIEITASVGDASITRTALVFMALDDRWGQPEAVPGMVNTLAYEDSSEISPDGNWLIVSSYSPVDLVCCFIGCDGGGTLSTTSAACNNSLGPVDAPLRPGMPGAARVVSPTEIVDQIPSMGLVGEGGGDFPFALPPVSAYGFERQEDGTFGNPFPISFDADGLTGAPFGFSFVKFYGKPSATGTARTFVYTWNSPAPNTSDNDDLYALTSAQMGSPVWLGNIELKDSVIDVVFASMPSNQRFPGGDQAETISNPFLHDNGQGYLPDPVPNVTSGVFFDLHGEEGIELDIMFVPFVYGTEGRVNSLGPRERVGISQQGRSEYQPFMYEDRLYYAAGEFESLASSPILDLTDPISPASWGPEATELSIEGVTPTTGSIVAIGEPSLGFHDEATWLYFVYGLKTETGTNSNIGRVRLR